MSTFVIHPTEEQEKIVKAFLEKQHIPFFKEEEDLPDFVLAGIAKGQEDIAAGHFITHDEFTKRISADK